MLTPEEIQAKIDEAVTGLKNKNTELLGKLKKAEEILSRVKDVDLDSLFAAKTELEEIKKKGDEERGEYKKLYETVRAEKDGVIAKLTNELGEAKGALVNMIKKSAVVSAITSNGITIPAPLFDIAINNIITEVAVDDSGKVLVGDRPVVDFVKDWSKSDVGKHFVASGNSGGGANGGTGGDIESESKYFDPKSPHFNLTEQAKLAKTNVDLYNRLKKQYS